MLYKIGIIGSGESILCYKACGFEIFTAKTPQEAQAGLKRLADSGCAILFITEELASVISEEIDKYRTSPVPAIIPLPVSGEKTGYGMLSLRADCRRAIGMDILK